MKTFFTYALTILIGLIVITADDIRWFLFYLLICLVFISYYINRRVDYNRKMLRVFWVASDTKLLALAKKLGVTKEGIRRMLIEEKATWGEENWKSFKKDMSDVMSATIIDDYEDK